MQHLELFQEVRKRLADGRIDRAGTETAADHEEHRALRRKAGSFISRLATAREEFGAYRRAGEHGLIFREQRKCLREVTADFGRRTVGEAVCESGCHIRLVDHGGNAEALCGAHHGHGDIAALRKDEVRLKVAQNGLCLAVTLQHAEGVGEVLPVEIAAQFSGGNAAVGSAGLFD